MQTNSKEKVIVTGGCGFIGSHLVDELVKKNYEVHVIDNLSAVSNDKFYFNENAFYYKISILNKTKIEKIFKDTKCVFHLAAESRIQTAIENPENAYQINVLGTLNILELCKKFKVERFILSTTSSVYGLTENLPTDETEKLNCLNPYSLSKYFSEELCKQYVDHFKVIILRYFNVYGERSPTNGQYAPVVGIFLNQLKNNLELTIVGDGEQRRDFIHVLDVVGVNIELFELNFEFHGDIYNIGSGYNSSVNEIANLISNKHRYIGLRPGEAKNTLAKIDKIKNLINFEPKRNIKYFIEIKKKSNF